MNCLVVRDGRAQRHAAGCGGGGGGGGCGGATSQMKRCIKYSKLVSNCPTVLLLAAAILVTCLQVFRVVGARYVHPTYKFQSALDEDLDRFERQASGGGPARRQDFDDDDDDNDDQNTAASYQNQDDNQNNNGASGGATDGYDDTEPDGPYEETPVEQEGQADLERFFDDHLGASDRDGMDKENLPSNLISLLSEPPLALSKVAPLFLMPVEQQQQQQQQQVGATVNSITVMPMASVVNQQVRPIRWRALDSAVAGDLFDVMSTVQETSFIRLPDEKLIVTHQVTARNRPSAPLKLAGGSQMSDFVYNSDEEDDRARIRAHTRKQPILSKPYGGGPAAERGSRGRVLMPLVRTTVSQQHKHKYKHQLRERDGDTLAAKGSEIVATENEDDDRVYVTNATDKPFKIDDLGGYDPEEDFIDAAEELEVMATALDRPRRPIAHTHRRPTNRASARRFAPRQTDQDDPYAWAASSAHQRRQEHSGKNQNELERDQLYGDASETDEVTFGQDDPYQTDLEAEMRQQEYDKISGWRREVPARRASEATEIPDTIDESPPDATGGSSNMAVDNGEQSQSGDDKNEDDEVDNEYQSEPRVEQTEARSARAASSPMEPAGIKQAKDEFDDEGGWANDGIEEMDIPSQAHQNTVLEKAAKKEEAARRAATDGADQLEDQSGQASDGESERMPNADYLKNDLKEDDSGYARAA